MVEAVVVDRLVKPAVLRIIDPPQFATVSKSLTNQALMNMFHQLTSFIVDNGSLVRVALFDFRKAFHLIEHHKLMRKFHFLEIPLGFIRWTTHFLTNRQMVQLRNGYYWSPVQQRRT